VRDLSRHERRRSSSLSVIAVEPKIDFVDAQAKEGRPLFTRAARDQNKQEAYEVNALSHGVQLGLQELVLQVACYAVV